MSEPVMPERKWKFGDFVRNRMAGETNPHRDGIFVRRIIRTGRLNPGTCAEMTNGRGEFWETAEKNLDPTPSIVSAEAKVAELGIKLNDAHAALGQLAEAFHDESARQNAAIAELTAALRFVQSCAVQCPACKQYVDAALNGQEKP